MAAKKLVSSGQVRLTDAEIDEILSSVKTACIQLKISWVSISLFGSRTSLSQKGGDIDLYLQISHTLNSQALYSLKNLLRIELCDRLGEQKFDIVIDDGAHSHSFIQSVVNAEKVDLWLNH